MECIFAPYFPSDDPHKFAIVHKVFGASNQQNASGYARVRDPVYGCVGAISFLQSQVSELQTQTRRAQAEILCIQMQQQVQDPMVQQIPIPTAAQAAAPSVNCWRQHPFDDNNFFSNTTTTIISSSILAM
ncbi:LOB domain-containing protein 12 [Hibiscus syriacus]|uniref:LOB domain-containing protein 12 n=1 Tax=Hibiscus syriacus TaxID=106335 RepID=A0A6A2ZDC2_HIBSY|nr:LOB domain-containing protein 12 [Hibiscus syriacus]